MQTAEMYRCPKGAANPNDDAGLPQPCLFVIHDGGPGRSIAHCMPHDYSIMFVDWTATHFGGGASVADAIGTIRELFTRLNDCGFERVDPTIPNIQQQQFGDVFNAIAINLREIAKKIEQAYNG